jgi:preprotein translocase SecF subunit
MIKNIKLWLNISAATIVVCMILIAAIRPNWGIDFTGGSLMEIEAEGISETDIRDIFDKSAGTEVRIQRSGDGAYIIRTSALSENVHQSILVKMEERAEMVQEQRFESIGPTIGKDLSNKALIAVGIVLVALVGYLAYTFRQSSQMISAWKFGIAAVYALIHDLCVVMAVFVILGKFYQVPIDTMFVTASLAILGYSVNDTIVIFQRLRATWLREKSGSLLDVLDKAVEGVLARSLNTSITTLLVLAALIALGGTTITWFILAIMIGTVAGNYSSIFVAPPLLYYLAKRQ